MRTLLTANLSIAAFAAEYPLLPGSKIRLKSHATGKCLGFSVAVGAARGAKQLHATGTCEDEDGDHIIQIHHGEDRRVTFHNRDKVLLQNAETGAYLTTACASSNDGPGILRPMFIAQREHVERFTIRQVEETPGEPITDKDTVFFESTTCGQEVLEIRDGTTVQLLAVDEHGAEPQHFTIGGGGGLRLNAPLAIYLPFEPHIGKECLGPRCGTVIDKPSLGDARDCLTRCQENYAGRCGCVSIKNTATEDGMTFVRDGTHPTLRRVADSGGMHILRTDDQEIRREAALRAVQQIQNQGYPVIRLGSREVRVDSSLLVDLVATRPAPRFRMTSKRPACDDRCVDESVEAANKFQQAYAEMDSAQELMMEWNLNPSEDPPEDAMEALPDGPASHASGTGDWLSMQYASELLREKVDIVSGLQSGHQGTIPAQVHHMHWRYKQLALEVLRQQDIVVQSEIQNAMELHANVADLETRAANFLRAFQPAYAAPGAAPAVPRDFCKADGEDNDIAGFLKEFQRQSNFLTQVTRNIKRARKSIRDYFSLQKLDMGPASPPSNSKGDKRSEEYLKTLQDSLDALNGENITYREHLAHILKRVQHHTVTATGFLGNTLRQVLLPYPFTSGNGAPSVSDLEKCLLSSYPSDVEVPPTGPGDVRWRFYKKGELLPLSRWSQLGGIFGTDDQRQIIFVAGDSLAAREKAQSCGEVLTKLSVPQAGDPQGESREQHLNLQDPKWEHCRANREVLLAIAKRRPDEFWGFAADHLLESKSFLLEAVEATLEPLRMILGSLDHESNDYAFPVDDYDLMLAAAKKQGSVLHYSKYLWKDPRHQLVAAQNDGMVLQQLVKKRGWDSEPSQSSSAGSSRKTTARFW